MPESYLEPKVNGQKLLTIFAKSSIVDVRLGSKYGSGYRNFLGLEGVNLLLMLNINLTFTGK